MKCEDKSTFDYWREVAPGLLAYGVRMGWVHYAPNHLKAVRAKRLETQRGCMKLLRDKNKQTKGNHNGSYQRVS
jgi:hypothetical protein